jgi:Protein of unknown function (DUF4019)
VVKPICVFIIASALIASAWALTLSQDDDHAREAALQWLQVVDSGNYKDAALMLSEQVRVTRDWANYLSANRARLGRLNQRLLEEVKHRSTIPGTAQIRNYDVIRFKTSFERKPVAFEEVLTAKMGCCWEIFGYEIK